MTTLSRALRSAFKTPTLSRDVKALFIHRLLLRVSFGATSVFGIIFYYEYFNNSVLAPLLAYTTIYILTALLTPLCARSLAHLGVRGSILLAVPLLFVATSSLYLLSTPYVPIPAWLAVGTSMLAASVYKSLYWVPYQVDMALELSRYEMGRSIAFLTNATELLIVATPFVGGMLVAVYGYDAMYFFGMVFVALSMLPVFFLREKYERFSWDYRSTFKRLTSKRYRPLVSAYIGDGVQSAALTVVWPLMIFLLLSKEYTVVGAIMALTFLAVLVLRALVGSLFDSWDKERVIFWGSILSASGWLFKLFVGTPVQIFAVDTYHNFGQVVNRTSMDAITYEQAADNGRYIDEFTALKEVALNLGRGAVLLLISLVAFISDVSTAFLIGMLLAAGATLITARIAKRVFVETSA